MLTRIVPAIAALTLGATAFAAPFIDAVGDFLPTYTGAQGGDLDVVSAEVFVNPLAGTFSVTATLNAPVGTTAGAFFVWGFDRGQGTERFVSGSPSVGQGVRFDSVLILRPDGTGQVNDLAGGGGGGALGAGQVVINGSTISTVDLPLTLLPTRGFAAPAYTWNLWPRLGTISGNAAISDFAPDASNAGVTVVPAPAAGVLLGVAGVVGLRRRR